MSYVAFLSGRSMANLHSLARSLMNIERPTLFVAPRAKQERDGEPDRHGLATLIVPESVASQREKVTNLVFVTGGAGGGKTALIQHLVQRSAVDYRSGRGGRLWLYVSAQGRRLAKLDDAVGRELGRMQAAFNYEAVSTLVRCGVLVLVIDGFDELLGIAGSYDESFSSLASFLDQLDGNGAVVAAARSAYYEQEFATRIDKAIGFRSEGWELKRIRLLDWDSKERAEYVRLRSKERGEYLDPVEVETLFGFRDVLPLAGKPFFVTRAVELLLDNNASFEGSGSSFVEQLVNYYLEREVRSKLIERAGRSYVTRDQLGSIFSEIAEEMWRQDSSELSSASVRELVAVLADLEGFDAETQLSLIDRAPYTAMLKSGSTSGSVAFEHDVYFAYFLSRPIVSVLRDGRELEVRRALRRTQMTVEAAEFAGQVLGDRGVGMISALCEAASVESPWQATSRRNAGYLTAAILRNCGPQQGLNLRSLDFLDCDLRLVRLTALDIRNCTLVGCDLTASVLQGKASLVAFERCQIDRSTTRLQLSGVDLSNFRVLVEYDNSSRKILYDPEQISAALRDCKLPAARDRSSLYQIAPALAEAIRQAAFVFGRTNLFTEADKDVRRLAESNAWPAVRQSLIDTDLLRTELRGASGRKAFLKVKVAPADLLAGQDRTAVVPQAVREFWSSVVGAWSSSQEA